MPVTAELGDVYLSQRGQRVIVMPAFAQDACGALHSAVARLRVTPTVPDAFSVRGYVRVMEEAARLVQTAEHTLVVSGWPREIDQLATELAAAHRRKVYAVLFSHARLSDSIAGIHFSYGVSSEHDLEAFWKHRLVMVADDCRCLIGAAEQSPDDTAVISETPAIAELATGQIALDITLLAQRHGHGVTEVMARLLGDRVGRLDTLLAAEPAPVLGEPHDGRA